MAKLGDKISNCFLPIFMICCFIVIVVRVIELNRLELIKEYGLILFFLAFSAIYFLTLLYDKRNNLKLLNINLYFYFSIVFVMLIFLLSTSYLLDNYSSKYPIKGNLENNGEIIGSYDCKSANHYTEFVASDRINCKFTTINHNLSLFYLNSVNNSPLFEDNFTSYVGNEIYENITINNGTFGFGINLYLGEITSSIGKKNYVITKSIEFREVIGIDEYNRRRRELFVNLFGILPLIFFTIFAGMNNLRQIIQNK